MSDLSEDALRVVLSASPIPLIVSRVSDGRILQVSESVSSIVGLTPAAAIGRSTLDFYADPEERAATVAALREKGALHGYEFRLRSASGQERWVIGSLVVCRLGGEDVIVSGLYDITERRRLEASLEDERNFVDAVLETAGALVVVLDREGRIVRFNRACETATGYGFGEVRGRPFWDILLLPEEVAGVRAVWDRLTAGEFPRQWENHWRTKDGGRRLVAWSNTALVRDGRVEHVIATGIDVTDLRIAQTRLFQSEKMAALGNLVAGIAHEINTPTGAIGSMHDTLVRAVGKLRVGIEESAPECCTRLTSLFDAVDEANRVIATGVDRVREIVRSLRSFARLDEAEVKDADVHDCIENSLTLLQHELRNRVDVVRNYGDLPAIICYPGRLNQVFLNILVNAAQAIAGKGTIAITTASLGNTVEIRFADTGPGIPPEALHCIFDPGFTTKGVGVGTGLGLSICYQIVRDHKGTIRAENAEGGGAVFTVTLPVAWDAPT